MGHRDDEGWLYHLPEFLERVRDRGAHRVADAIDDAVDGVVYHHRGARLPAYDATFVWRDDAFELELDAVGPRTAWAAFDADRSWDAYLYRAPGDEPCLVWMTDSEFRAEEAARFDSKQDAVAAGRFSFGLSLHDSETWPAVAERTRTTDAPLFVARDDGRTYAPEATTRDAFQAALPPELRPNDERPPPYLGVLEVHVDAATGRD